MSENDTLNVAQGQWPVSFAGSDGGLGPPRATRWHQPLLFASVIFMCACLSPCPAVAQPTSAVVSPAGLEAETKPSVLIEEPKPELERPTVWGEPTEVQIGLYVIDVDEVNSADQSFAASVYFEARWNNPFLQHEGPGPKLRSLTDVWNPRLTIIGQQSMWRSYPESVEIQPNGTVVYRQKIWGRFSQPLSLQDFPFDQQELSIHLVAAGLSEDEVKIVNLVTEIGGSSGIARKFSLPDFDVISFAATPEAYYPREGHPGAAGFEMSKTRITRSDPGREPGASPPTMTQPLR